MVVLWIIIVMLCLLTTAGGALIALRIQYRTLDNSRQEREGWQQAQEGRQRTWEVRQGKHILSAEKKLADQLKEARREWRDWGTQVQQDHQEWRDSVDLETMLARLPNVEEVELAHQQAHGGRLQAKNWHPPLFYKANLHGRDLSYRYLERADLREAQITEANLYMADLTGASLTGANLQDANLIGANLSGTDLRGANLSGVNLLVADLHNAVLHGTNLTGARNLTPEQLQTAIYDSTTIIDSAIDITLPRIPSVQTTPPTLLTFASAVNGQIDKASGTQNGHEANASATSSTMPGEYEMPVPSVEIVANSSISSTEDVNTESVPADSLAVSTPVSEDTTPVLVAEVSASMTASPNENASVIAGSAVPASETQKKSSTNRKRTSKAKQATTHTQTLASIQDETGRERANESTTSIIEENLDEEELLPYKIIQLQARTVKTRPLAGSGEQNKDEQSQKKRGNSRTTSFNTTTNDSENQRAHAN